MKTCSICEKGYYVGGTRKLLRGHYNPTSDSRKKPNLQWVTILGKSGRIKVCTKCLKKIKKSTVPTNQISRGSSIPKGIGTKKTVKSTSTKSIVKK